MTDKILIFSTASSLEEAEAIARQLLTRKIAACVNILPGVRSVYRWKGEVEEATEVQLIIKTRRELFAQIQTAIKAAHSYEVPEIIALPVVAGSEPYLEWIDHETA